MIQYNEEIAANLNGLKPINWEAAKAAFKIEGFKPEKLKIVPRNELLIGLVDVGGEKAIEKMMADDDTLRYGNKEQKLLRLCARQYCQLANKNARLPKFSKWVTSLFKDDKEMHNELAKYGQGVPKAPFTISCNPVDILRAADTEHFWSCLTHDGGFRDVLPGVLEHCPGIAVAYVNGDNGKMQGRIWIHLGEDKAGKKVIILASSRYGTGLEHNALAEYLAAKGFDVYKDCRWDGGGNEMALKYVECFKHNVHWDTYTWNNAYAVRLAVAK